MARRPFRTTILPRDPRGRVIVVDSDERPRFEGGAIIVNRPTEGDPRMPTLDRIPFEMAWPLDITACVIVDVFEDDQ